MQEISKNSLNQVEKIIDYRFNNPKLLVIALTHSSFAHEKMTQSYQSFEFLGDSILDFIVAEHLIKIYPKATEGMLTKYRAKVVAKDPLADVIDNAGLDDYILTSGGDIPSRKTRSDIFESLIAAIYYDSGIDNARIFAIKFLEGLMIGKTFDNDYKTQLLELATKLHKNVDFQLKRTFGPQHRPIFVYDALVDDVVFGSGEDTSKRSAQQEAARIALKKFK